MYLIDKTNQSYSRTSNRSADFQELSKEAKTNPDPAARQEAVRAMDSLKHESKDVQDMRESLIRAHRNNDINEIKDIHDIVSKKEKYQTKG